MKGGVLDVLDGLAAANAVQLDFFENRPLLRRFERKIKWA